MDNTRRRKNEYIRKAIINSYELYPSQALEIITPLDFKQSIRDFLKSNDTIEEVIPIIIDGCRLFSIYIYHRKNLSYTLLSITKYGAAKISSKIGDYYDLNDMKKELKEYFSRKILDERTLMAVLNNLNLLIKNYISHRKNMKSPYFPGNLNGKHICIIYMLPKMGLSELKSYLVHSKINDEIDIRYRTFSV